MRSDALGPMTTSARPLLPSGPAPMVASLEMPSPPAPLAPPVSQPSAFQPVVPSRPTTSRTPPLSTVANGPPSILRRGPATPPRSDEDSSPAPSSSGSDDRMGSPSDLRKSAEDEDEEEMEDRDRDRDEDNDGDEDEAEERGPLKEAGFPTSHRVPLGGQNAFAWPAHLADDERRQLLGTEEESSERPSSDDEDPKEEWNITREQLNYYTTQFFSMQSDPRGVIPGCQAKEFFEKSHLPIAELRQIWQLSDVTMDGCLSLEEFLTAMHLVVLRRNAIELPQKLPVSLLPQTLRTKVVDRHNKDLYRRDGDALDGGADSLLEDTGEPLSQNESDRSEAPSSASRRSRVHHNESGGLTSPGSISSPGPKPVNFDFHRPDARRNPHLVQPVAMRLSPESPVIPTSDDEDQNTVLPKVRPGRREVVYEQLWNQEDVASATEESLSSLTLKAPLPDRSKAGRPSSSLDKSDMTDEEEVENSTEIDSDGNLSPSPVRPIAPSGFSSAGGTSLPYFSDALQRMKKVSPPLPPPRVAYQTPTSKTHARSSSLDLNQFQNQFGRSGVRHPPAVPPRVETSSNSEVHMVGKGVKGLQISIHQLKDKNKEALDHLLPLSYISFDEDDVSLLG
ncbi:hypothetical protein TCAL_15062 [Tigriopus californicus]|uniref:EF-hand domain-containing protein n=1 Tax=Tigriopus californicus TaxID=6832 RepID=A0A553NY06_TIGCA|nr:hypothetical protein TCAL_15062 [Tigriopus californicus]